MLTVDYKSDFKLTANWLTPSDYMYIDFKLASMLTVDCWLQMDWPQINNYIGCKWIEIDWLQVYMSTNIVDNCWLLATNWFTANISYWSTTGLHCLWILTSSWLQIWLTTNDYQWLTSSWPYKWLQNDWIPNLPQVDYKWLTSLPSSWLQIDLTIKDLELTTNWLIDYFKLTSSWLQQINNWLQA